MTSAGRYLTTSNGLTDWFPDATGNPESSIGKLTNTADQMKDEIRRQAKAGVDLIKLADSPYGDFQAFTDDELKMCADLAHQLKLKITIHARGDAEMNAAVNAGFDHIMHGNFMSDATIENLAKSQIPLAPTQLFMHHIVEFAEISRNRPSIVEATKRMNDATQETLHRAYAGGVKFAMGTDSGFATVPYGVWHARELEMLMRYTGMSSLEAIQAGTKHGANAMGLDGEVGVLAEGKLADIIVVDGDPLADIRVLYTPGKITHVILNGAVQTFPDDIRTRFIRNNYLPHEYGWEILSYERVFDGGELAKTQLDWPRTCGPTSSTTCASTRKSAQTRGGRRMTTPANTETPLPRAQETVRRGSGFAGPPTITRVWWCSEESISSSPGADPRADRGERLR